MSAPDTVSGAPVPDRPRPAGGRGEQPDPTGVTASIPGPRSPGPYRTDRGTTPGTTERVGNSATPIPGPIFPTIPGYRILDVLGRGGMGTVYHALDLDLGREVALKLISPGGRDESAVRGRFEREVRALARIEHPNIVPIYDAGEWQGFFPYFTMKLVPGGPLSRHLDRFRDDVRGAVKLVAKVARAVGALHAAGVLHRDLKPLNILLADHDEPLVADFGLARWLGDDSGPTESGSPVGTRAYMSPEQSLGGRADYTPACDVWAIGVVLFELLTGRRPFVSDDPVELYLKIRTEPAPPAAGFNPAVPAELDAVIGRCLAKRPEDRYPSAVAAAEDLERWLAGERVEAAVPATAPRTPARPRRTRTHRLVLLGVLLIASTAVGVLVAPQSRAPRGEQAPQAADDSRERAEAARQAAQAEAARKRRSIAEQLAAGETVELVGPTGKLGVGYHGIPGFDTLVSPEQDGGTRLTSAGLGAVELCGEILPGRVRLEAEVRIAASFERTSTAGIYVGRKETPAAGVIHQTAIQFLHTEAAERGPPGSAKGPRVDPVIIQSTATVVARWDVPRPSGGFRRVYEPTLVNPTKIFGYEPTLTTRWHTWKIGMTPDVLSATCDDQQLPPVTTRVVLGRLNDSARGEVGKAKDRNPGAPPPAVPTFTDPAFGPGLGLYVRQGAATFRNVRLVPMP